MYPICYDTVYSFPFLNVHSTDVGVPHYLQELKLHYKKKEWCVK